MFSSSLVNYRFIKTLGIYFFNGGTKYSRCCLIWHSIKGTFIYSQFVVNSFHLKFVIFCFKFWIVIFNAIKFFYKNFLWDNYLLYVIAFYSILFFFIIYSEGRLDWLKPWVPLNWTSRFLAQKRCAILGNSGTLVVIKWQFFITWSYLPRF